MNPNDNVLLKWDQTGERFYETGVSRGVLYPKSTGKGVVWNGLTAVNQQAEGGEPTALYADDIKYLNLLSNENFKATVEAYTYPDEWAECDGSAQIATGVYAGQQERKPFGLSYVTRIGNDEDGSDHGYKIHLVYNGLASPSDRSYETINDSPSAITFSWEVSTTPENVPGMKPTAHIEIDSTKVNADKLASFEKILYGTPANPDAQQGDDDYVEIPARLPLPSEVISHFGTIG